MSLMREEALESPARVRKFLSEGIAAARAAGVALRLADVRYVEVLARGSSSHAGTALRYAFAAVTDLRLAAAMPSRAVNPLPTSAWQGVGLIGISQSGRSPDLIRYMQMAEGSKACRIGLINVDGSPLGATVEQNVPLCAGPEKAVAATKSVILSIVAGLGLLAGYRNLTNDDAHLAALPERLDDAARRDWSALSAVLAAAPAAFVVGRGPQFGAAKEIALKIAETVGVPALAYSSAEFLHGPLGAVSAATPVIGLLSDARDAPSVLEALARARGQGARTLLAHGQAGLGVAADLPLPPAVDAGADAAVALLPAYLAIEAAAIAAGRDPDSPRGLAKVTETV